MESASKLQAGYVSLLNSAATGQEQNLAYIAGSASPTDIALRDNGRHNHLSNYKNLKFRIWSDEPWLLAESLIYICLMSPDLWQQMGRALGLGELNCAV